jgi:homoserine dehydrogenase
MGGTSEAYKLVKASLENGKHVVTANKALLAECGEELFRLAVKKQRHLLFEASVAGGIPIIKSLREGLIANRILSVHGIINGTCNYILSEMSQNGMDYAEALAKAKHEGYAEADESLDVDGHDTAHKAAILAALAHGFWIKPEQLYTEGIAKIERQDLIYARELGYELKLLAIIKTDPKEAVEIRVHPTLIPRKHVLASVNGVFNALAVRGDVVGDTLFYGRGAGADATASAVLGDIAEIARNYPSMSKCQAPSCESLYAKVKSMDDIVSRYYLRLKVADQPGVLAKVATVLASRKIGISSVIQPPGQTGKFVPLIIMLHDAQEKQFRAAIHDIEKLEVIKGHAVSIRVEDFE